MLGNFNNNKKKNHVFGYNISLVFIIHWDYLILFLLENTLFTHILISKVSKHHGPSHHSQKKDCACGFCQAFSVTDEVPLKSRKWRVTHLWWRKENEKNILVRCRSSSVWCCNSVKPKYFGPGDYFLPKINQVASPKDIHTLSVWLTAIVQYARIHTWGLYCKAGFVI